MMASGPAEAETKLALSGLTDLVEPVERDLYAGLPPPQRHALEELVGQPPADVPPRLGRSRQALGDQGRLADAGLALDPDHRSLAAAEGIGRSVEGCELVPAAYPLRRPVDRPHGSNIRRMPILATVDDRGVRLVGGL